MPLDEILILLPSVAFVVCVPRFHGHIEGVEDPHGHWEPPSDRILSDFHTPNSSVQHHHHH